MKKRGEMRENKIFQRPHRICGYKTIKKKARKDIRKHTLHEILETIEASKNLKTVRRTYSLGKNRMVTLLDEQGKAIQEQDIYIRSFERIE